MADAVDVTEQAIAKMEAEEAGKVVDDDKKRTTTEDAGAGKPKSGEDDKGGADGKKPDADKKEPPKPKYDKDGNRIEDTEEDETEEDDAKGGKKDKDDEGFTADDALEVDDDTPPPDATKVAPTDASGVVLSAAEQKYISEHIGEIGDPVMFQGTVDGKAATYKVYDVRQLPANFQPDSVVGFQQGLKTLDTMEKKAEQLLANYRNEQSQTATQDFERRENEAIRTDVADLQKAGDFPKFKIQPGQPGFDDDPAAKQVGEVVEFMTERNEQYLKEYQQGRAYRHIGFREAFELWSAKQNVEKAKKNTEEATKKEDDERKERASRIGGNRGLTASNLVKPTVRSGTTVEQILARHESEM